jgi:hypothetical protein
MHSYYLAPKRRAVLWWRTKGIYKQRVRENEMPDISSVRMLCYANRQSSR